MFFAFATCAASLQACTGCTYTSACDFVSLELAYLQGFAIFALSASVHGRQIGFGISVAPTGPTLAQTSRQTLWSRTSTFWRSQRIGCYETVSGKASKHSCRLHDPSLEAALARFKSVILNMPYMRQEPIGLLRGLVSATSSVNRSTREA